MGDSHTQPESSRDHLHFFQTTFHALCARVELGTPETHRQPLISEHLDVRPVGKNKITPSGRIRGGTPARALEPTPSTSRVSARCSPRLAPSRPSRATPRRPARFSRVASVPPRQFLAHFRNVTPLRARARARALFFASARRGLVLAAANSAGVDSEPASASASSADDVVMYAFNDDGSATVSAIAFDVAAADSGRCRARGVRRAPPRRDSRGVLVDFRGGARPAPAAPAAPGRVAAEGQHEDPPWPPSPATTMLCMLYGVDQDKEDAKHKVAFFDVDAVVDPEALRRVLAAAAAESRRPDPIAPSETTETIDLVARFEAARSRCPAWARVALAPAFALITLLLRAVRVFAPSASSTVSSPSETRPFASLRGTSCAEADTSRLATALHDAHIAPAVYPEAERYAKQLRYDGYKIVLVTSAPEFLVARARARARRVSRHRRRVGENRRGYLHRGVRGDARRGMRRRRGEAKPGGIVRERGGREPEKTPSRTREPERTPRSCDAWGKRTR